MASTGQTFTHLPQPLQASSLTFGQEIGGGDGVQHGEALGREHGLAAAAAAVADEGHTVLHVLAKLHEVVLLGHVQQVHAFLHVHLARVPVLDQRLRRTVEGHADVHRGVAGLVEVLHLVAAVAGADAHVGGSVDHLAGSLVVHHREGVVPIQRLLVHEGAAQLGFAPGEEVLHKVLFHVQVLVIELRQQFLVVAIAHAHHGELEEARHRRRQHENLLPVQFHVQQHPLRSQGLQNLLGFQGGLLPDLGRGGYVEGLDGKQRHQGRFVLGKQHLKNAEEQFGRRRALRKQVEPVGKRLVALLQIHMGHRRPRI